MSALDEAKANAAKALREWVQIEARYGLRGIAHKGQACDRLDRLAQTFVTEQARYTNMLRDWENDV